MSLRIAILNVDFMTSAACGTISPLTDEDSTPEERKALVDLAERAERFAATLAASRGSRSVVNEAWLIASYAWRATGHLHRSWQLLEQVCSDEDDPEALTAYAWQAGYGVLVRHLQIDDCDAEYGPPPAAAAAKGMVRAQKVLARAAIDATIDLSHVLQARQGLFLCALELHDAGAALPAALLLRNEEGAHPQVRRLCGMVIDDGGVRLSHLIPDMGAEFPAQTRTRLLEACMAMERALGTSTLSGESIVKILASWRRHPVLGLELSGSDPAWQQLKTAVAALEALATRPAQDGGGRR